MCATPSNCILFSYVPTEDAHTLDRTVNVWDLRTKGESTKLSGHMCVCVCVCVVGVVLRTTCSVNGWLSAALNVLPNVTINCSFVNIIFALVHC